MLVLCLVSMFTGDSKLTIGTKINIIRGSISKILGGGLLQPPPSADVLQKMAQADEG